MFQCIFRLIRYYFNWLVYLELYAWQYSPCAWYSAHARGSQLLFYPTATRLRYGYFLSFISKWVLYFILFFILKYPLMKSGMLKCL